MRKLRLVSAAILLSATAARADWTPIYAGTTLDALRTGSGQSGVRFLPTPLVRQALNFTCGAAALQSLLEFYGEDFREGQLQQILHSDPKLGTSYQEMVKLVTELNDPVKNQQLHATLAPGEVPDAPSQPTVPVRPMAARALTLSAPTDDFQVVVYPGKSTTIRTDTPEAGVPVDGLTSLELQQILDQGRPVIVLIQAWGNKTLDQYATDKDDGHYVVAVGYDAANFYFMDPSTAGNYTFIPRDEFLRRWHDVDSRLVDGHEVDEPVTHFGLVAYKAAPQFIFSGISKLE